MNESLYLLPRISIPLTLSSEPSKALSACRNSSGDRGWGVQAIAHGLSRLAELTYDFTARCGFLSHVRTAEHIRVIKYPDVGDF